MARAKVAVTIEEETLRQLDQLVSDGVFSNRSRAIEAAVSEKLERLDRTRLARELEHLEPSNERSLAEEGMVIDGVAWPAY